MNDEMGMTEWNAEAVRMGLVALRLLPTCILLPKSFGVTFARHWSLATVAMLTLVVAPSCSLPAELIGGTSTMLLSAVGREILRGLALGAGFAVLLAGLHLAGLVLSHVAGLSWAGVVDPGANWPGGDAVQRYFAMLAFAVFWTSGSYRTLVAAALDSFTWMAPGSTAAPQDHSVFLADLLAHSFVTGIRVAAPIAFCLLVASGVLALLGRGTSFLGALGLGLTVNLVVLLVVTSLSLQAIAQVYQAHWSSGVERIADLWMATGG